MTVRHGHLAAIAVAAALAGMAAGSASAQTADRVATPAAAGPGPFPGGASAISETHGNWVVNCNSAGGTKACSLSHQQFDTSNNQRVLAIELSPPGADGAAGTIALPFGLSLPRGIGLQIDETRLDGVLAFSTCFVVGCLVPVTLTPGAVEQAKAGTALKIEAVANDSGQTVAFTVPLAGFGGALARTLELSAD